MYSIDNMPNQIDIGFTGEKNFRNVEIDMTKWMMRMPNGYPSIVHIRPGEKTSDAYIAVTTFENNILTWIVSDADLGPKEGIGSAQIWLEETQNDSVVKRGKSIKVATQIHGAINDASATPPTGQEAFLEQVNTLKNAAVAAAQSAYEYKEDALDAKDAAKSAVNDAVSAKDDAVDAKDAAESAQGNAEAAQTAAETAQGLAEAAQAAAEGAQEAAETAQGLAENAQAAAEDAQEAAEAAQEGAEAAILHAPIIEDDVWMVWDPDEEDYVSTGVTAEGVDGSSAYVHIKYAASQPTQDSDMKDSADAWMGIYSGDSSTAPTTYTSYTWYKIKGDSGGDPTSIIDDTAGSGTTNKVWSADKSSSLLNALNVLTPAATSSDIGKALIVKTVADGKPTSYEYGEAGGGSVDPSAIAQAVADWCDDNITENPTVVIDKSLLVEGAAADAKAAGDRIGVLENMSHPQKTALITPFVQGTIDDSTGAAETSDTTKCHSAKIAVKAGDTVAYSRYNSNIAFASSIFYYDAEGSFLSSDTFSSGTTVTFSTDGMFAIRCAVNSGAGGTISTAITSAENSFTGTIDVTPKIVDAVADAVAGAEIQHTDIVLNISNVNIINNSIYKSTGVYEPFLNGRRTDYIPVTPGDTVKYRLWDYFLSPTYQYAVAAFDDDFTLVDHVAGSGAEAGYVTGTYTVPSGASYVMLSWNYDDIRDGWFEINVATLTEKIKDYIHRTSKLQKSILNGKQWCCLGDSLTQGGGTTTKMYQMFIEDRTGITAYNYGLSATAITKDTASTDHNMATRYSSMYSDVDYVTVFGGTNDHGRSLPIGQWGDADQMTLYGAMKILCEGLITKYLGKKIGFILPCPKCTTKDDVTTDYSYPSESFTPYIECIKNVCARYSIPVLDLYTQSGLHPSIADYRTAYMPDGLHPNNSGQELLSYRIQSFLESL